MAGQAGLVGARSSAIARPAADAAEVEPVLPGSDGAGAEAPAEVLLDAGVAGPAGTPLELDGALAAPGAFVDRPARTPAVPTESRTASRQSAAVGAAGQAGPAQLSTASAEMPDRAAPEDERELAAAGVRVEPERAAAQCTSLDGSEALPEALAEEACCEAAFVVEDAQTLSTSLRGRVSGCAGSEAAAPITVRDIVSEWLINGHEVVTVRQGSARARVLAHAMVHAVGGNSDCRR